MAPATPLMIAKLALEQAIASREELKVTHFDIIQTFLQAENQLRLAVEELGAFNRKERLARLEAYGTALDAYTKAHVAYTTVMDPSTFAVKLAKARLDALEKA